MKILSGFLKNRDIDFDSTKVRPTMGKVRSSIFNMLGDDGILNKSVLDLFAGTGSFSFEAISIGAASAVLVDMDQTCVANIIKNVVKFGLENQMRCYLNKFDVALKLLGNKKREFDIIFLDPPYFFVEYRDLLENIYRNNILSKGGIIVLEHERKTDVETDRFVLKKQKIFGSTVIKIFGDA